MAGLNLMKSVIFHLHLHIFSCSWQMEQLGDRGHMQRDLWKRHPKVQAEVRQSPSWTRGHAVPWRARQDGSMQHSRLSRWVNVTCDF